jgi:hypothetical protein
VVLPDIGVVIFPDVAVREALAAVGEPMLAQQAPGVTLLRPDRRFVQVVSMPPGQLVEFLDDEDLRTGAV